MHSEDLVLSSSLRWKLAQAFSSIYRFQALPLTRYLFDDCPPSTFVERDLFGYKFVGDVSRASPQRLIYLTGARFMDEVDVLRELVKPGMHVVDVGANIGYYVLFFASLIGPKGSITAIEPSPENLGELRQNIARNGLTNVRLVPKAVGDEHRETGLRAGINSGVADDERAPFRIEIDFIDSIATSRVDMLKIDIDGYEAHALKGATRILEHDRPVLFVETHPTLLPLYGSSAEEVVSIAARYYDKLTIYEPVYPPDLFGKALKLYFGRKTNKIDDVEEFLKRPSTRTAAPFWVVGYP